MISTQLKIYKYWSPELTEHLATPILAYYYFLVSMKLEH